MTKLEKIQEGWRTAASEMLVSLGFSRLRSGGFSREEYASVLCQVALLMREHPQFLATFASQLRGSQRVVAKKLLEQKMSDCDYDSYAAKDLNYLGFNSETLLKQRPLPSTIGLLGFAYYQLTHENPVGYFGYLLHFELLPFHLGQELVSKLEENGIPREGMRFLCESMRGQFLRDRSLEQYLEKLVLSDQDLESVLYVAKVTARLFGDLVTESISNRRMIDRVEPYPELHL